MLTRIGASSTASARVIISPSMAEQMLAWISTAHNLPNIFAFSALLDQAERAAAGRRRVLHEEAAQGLVLSLARRRRRLKEAAALY
jgi:hypothetical protein